MPAEIDRIMAITLEDLALVYTNHLPVDALQLTVADCHDLGYVLIEKSASNLFFFRQLLEKAGSYSRKTMRHPIE